MASFGQRLKELRLSLGLSQEELANKFSVSKQAISQYERGLRFPKDYEQIADFFNVDMDYLMGRTDFTTRIVRGASNVTPIFGPSGSLSPEEHAVVTGYRAADQPTKTVVKRLLNVEHEEPVLNAAHDMGATEEEKQRADDIMMNDDEWK